MHAIDDIREMWFTREKEPEISQVLNSYYGG